MKLDWRTFQTLTEDNIRKSVTTSSGIYLLWVKLENGKWRCYYIGIAENLEQRLLDHLSTSETNACIKEHVTKHTSCYEYAEVSKQSDHDGAEKFLYDHFKPECNRLDPGGTAIEVNIP